jgi:hypothetical protein
LGNRQRKPSSAKETRRQTGKGEEKWRMGCQEVKEAEVKSVKYCGDISKISTENAERN